MALTGTLRLRAARICFLSRTTSAADLRFLFLLPFLALEFAGVPRIFCATETSVARNTRSFFFNFIVLLTIIKPAQATTGTLYTAKTGTSHKLIRRAPLWLQFAKNPAASGPARSRNGD